jgi:hypothetical protein
MGPQWHQVIAASRRSHWVSLANSSDPNHTWWDTSGLLVEGFPGKVDGWRMIGDDSQSKQNILESLNMFSIVQHICRLRWMPRIEHLKHNWRVARSGIWSSQQLDNGLCIDATTGLSKWTLTLITGPELLSFRFKYQSKEVFFPTNWSHRRTQSLVETH